MGFYGLEGSLALAAVFGATCISPVACIQHSRRLIDALACAEWHSSCGIGRCGGKTMSWQPGRAAPLGCVSGPLMMQVSIPCPFGGEGLRPFCTGGQCAGKHLVVCLVADCLICHLGRWSVECDTLAVMNLIE